MGPLARRKLHPSRGAADRRGRGLTSEEDSWNVFSHSRTLVNIPESQNQEGLADQQFYVTLTLGSLARLQGGCGPTKPDAKVFLCIWEELHLLGAGSRGFLCFSKGLTYAP